MKRNHTKRNHWMKRCVPVLLTVISVIILFLIGNSVRQTVFQTKSKFRITVLKAGKADAIVLQTEQHYMVIDCGEEDDGGKIIKYLNNQGVSQVDYLFLTHFDKDHAGGFPEVAEQIAIDTVIVPDYHTTKPGYQNYLQTVAEQNIQAVTLTDDFSFTEDGVTFDVSVPKQQKYSGSDNNFSLVISVTYGEHSFLFAGDAEEERLQEIMDEFAARPYDVLKVPHHGKTDPLTKEFVSAVKPAYAIICDSEKHPAEEETLSALLEAGSRIYRTKNGDISIVSDGKTIKITQ